MMKQRKNWLTLMIKKKNIKEPNPHWPQISNHSYRILIIGGSISEETSSFKVLIKF